MVKGGGTSCTKAFISRGWNYVTVDWLIDPSHDLADEERQASLSSQLEEVIFIAGALDGPGRFLGGSRMVGQHRGHCAPCSERSNGCMTVEGVASRTTRPDPPLVDLS